MANFFTDNDDLRFYFDRGIDWTSLVEATEYGFRTEDGFKTVPEAVEFYREVANSMGALFADQGAPRAAQIDRDGNHLVNGEAVCGAAMDDLFSAIKSAELHKLCIPRELGGLNAPLIVYFLGAEMLARVDVSAMTHFSFHGGMAMAMLVYSLNEGTTSIDVSRGRVLETRFAEEIQEIARGDAWGCMDITEPNAGSDMAALRTVGEQDEAGNWFVTGQKIFITSGHGKYHFVIARTEGRSEAPLPTRDFPDSRGGMSPVTEGRSEAPLPTRDFPYSRGGMSPVTEGRSEAPLPTRDFPYSRGATSPATAKQGAGDDPFAGLSGLSMFLVKAFDDLPDGTRVRHVTLERVEEKLGHHGSVTAALSFDRAPARLIGKRGEGFKYMLTLMNNARVGVAFESLGLAECAYRMARAYAEERHSMGKPIAQHGMIADYLDEMQTDIQGVRALAVASACHEEASQKLALMEKFAAAGTPELPRIRRELPHHRARARRFTPLLKYLAGEKAVEIARRNVQIHGGVGYTKEYGAEKLLRDALVLPIYEGTSQIQSLMAMKDTLLGIVKRPQAFVARLGQARWRSVSARDGLERRVAKVQSLALSAQQFLLTRTAGAKLKKLGDVPLTTWSAAIKSWDAKRDFGLAMLHAERLTRILADEAICELLLLQAKAHPERRELLERYLDRAELRCRALHEEITTTGERILAKLAEHDVPRPTASVQSAAE